jgi:hypothetical protein
MRGQMPVALLAIVFGALETAGAVQELVYRGILASLTEPLIIGALGTVAGGLLLAAGIALLVSSPLTTVLVPAAAYVSIPVFILSGIVKHYAGWPITLVGIAYPLIMLFYYKKFARFGDGLSKS